MGTTLVVVVLTAAVAGLTAALALAWHQRAAAQGLVEDLRRGLEEGRDRSVSAAVEHVVTMAREQLGAATAAGAADLGAQGQAISQRVDAMRTDLGRVVELVHELERDREHQLGALSTELRRTGETTTSLAQATATLREALTASPARGRWGERMADDVLRTAGLVEGINYRRQQSFNGGRPDVTFLLPGDQLLHMDVKFPLDNYLRYLECEDEDRRAQLLAAFLKDVRSRIRELSSRDYIDPANGTLDQVLLFLPNEHVYGFVHQHDDGVIDLAMERNVVLCSPLTLVAVLGVIRRAVDDVNLRRTSDQILEVLAGFTKQWERFTDQLDTVGTRLESTRRAYDDLAGVRRRQLERHLDRVDDLRTERLGPAAESARARALHAVDHDDEGGGALTVTA